MMPPQFTERGEIPIQSGELSLPDFDISWAGSCPWRPSYCYGSEDGRVWFMSHGDFEANGRFNISPSKEAINGIAFGAGRMAVSTRSEIVFLADPFSREGGDKKAIYFGGSHGVVATETGGFVAPLGRRGVLLMGEAIGTSPHARILTPAQADFYVYKLAILSDSGRGTILAMAGRQAGLVSVSLSDENQKASGKHLHPHGVDFIDVTGLGIKEFPFAVAALSLDCSIHFARDLYNDRSARRLHFCPPGERAYRLICAEGHLFLLTDRNLYIFPSLARWFIEGQKLDGRMDVIKLEIQAVDMTLSDDRALLVVMPASVLRLDVDSLISQKTSQVTRAEPGQEPTEELTDEELTWEQSEELELACI